MVFGDEISPVLRSNVLKGILEKMKNVRYRFGTTGTLDGSEVHKLQLEGLFGGISRRLSVPMN